MVHVFIINPVYTEQGYAEALRDRLSRIPDLTYYVFTTGAAGDEKRLASTIEDIFEGEKHHPYTEGLFGSIPSIEVDSDRLSPIDGLMADPANLPEGCYFYDRCSKCMEKCKSVVPQPKDMGNGHVVCCHLYE